MIKSDLLAVLRAIATSPNHELATDTDVAQAAHGAAHAIDVRLTSDPNTLPDYDALRKPPYSIPGQQDDNRSGEPEPE